MRKVVAKLASVLALATHACPPPTAVASEPQPIAMLQRFDDEARRTAGTVSLRGIVTHLVDHSEHLVVQDNSGAIWVQIATVNPGTSGHATPRFPLPADLSLGADVIATGRLDRGGYAPRLVATAIDVTGHPGRPEPRSISLDRVFAGIDNGLFVRATGVIRGLRSGERTIQIGLRCGGRDLAVTCLRQAGRFDREQLVDACVEVVGVVGSIRNPRGEFLAPVLAISGSDDVRVIDPAPGPPFASPRVPLERLGGFDPDRNPDHRVVVEGMVTACFSGRLLFLQEGDVAVRVRPTVDAAFTPGDRVRAAGFIDTSRRMVALVDAVVEVVDRERPPAALPVDPGEIWTMNIEAQQRRVIASRRGLDGCLVTFPAEVIRGEDVGGRAQLELVSRRAAISAVVPVSLASLPDVTPGATVQVTGVLQVDMEDRDARVAPGADPQVERVSLLVRGPEDVKLLRPAAFWTLPRLALLVATAATALAAALAWAGLLRRQVRLATARLAVEMRSRRDATVEFEAATRERNRLAANLHDTLLQKLQAVDFQMDACRMSAGDAVTDGLRHLDVAHRMVKHAAEELRGSVWALRTTPAAGSFVETLQDIVGNLEQGRAEHIRLRIVGQPFPLPQFLSGNLLLVAQEAIHNALVHADAGQIDVVVRFDAGRSEVELVVRDDGQGFVPGRQTGPTKGHFGLVGMEERIARIGGTFMLDSLPERGTTVQARVRRRDYDAGLEGAGEEETGLEMPGDVAPRERK
jgi:signal transduction histidine kinase